MEAIDYGIETDHLSAKISILGTVAEIYDFKQSSLPPAYTVFMAFDKGEKPFGPAFNCEAVKEYLLTDKGGIDTANKGLAQMSFHIAASPFPPWTYEAAEFNLANFAVQEVKREPGWDKNVSQTEAGWAAFSHYWLKPKFTLSLLANSETMGATIRWLAARENRSKPFSLKHNRSMHQLSENFQTARCLSFGNLRRLGNSNMWQADFDFVEAF
jgi:hypothetical protein